MRPLVARSSVKCPAWSDNFRTVDPEDRALREDVLDYANEPDNYESSVTVRRPMRLPSWKAAYGYRRLGGRGAARATAVAAAREKWIPIAPPAVVDDEGFEPAATISRDNGQWSH
jgi:hypothetical protein